MFKFPTLLHGGDYNPDQWLDRPDVLAQDIELMKQAKINCATLGIFAWAKLEPREGEYDFDWLSEIIENLYKNGIYTILSTPSGAKPYWLAEKYEETRRINRDGVREISGNRHNHCLTSPIYREKVARINEKLSQKFGKNPAVILWHLSNEYSGECYCDHCVSAFRDWLKNKYKTLENLNHEWWTAFWSHTYTDWSQINPPFAIGEGGTHGLSLDWKRFVTDQTVDFMRGEINAVRKHSELPVTTNLMGFFDGLNYFKFARDLDIVSWDSYPRWHCGNDVETAVFSAMTHDLMRSIKHEPFLLMESTPSMTNWQHISKLKKPGMHLLSSIQAVAHGADSVQYFQWRKSRGATEKFHGAVVDHVSHGGTRVFRDVCEVGENLQQISDICGAKIMPKVAVVYDWENRWAIDMTRGPRNCGMHYIETIADHYSAFWELGISVDFVDCECDLSPYKLVVAPMLYMHRAGIERKLSDFVQNGGTLVGTYFSGYVNENDLCYMGGFPGGGLRDIFGVWAEEIDALSDGEHNSFAYGGKTYKTSDLCEIIHAESAEILAVYDGDFYAEKPVLTRKNNAYYLASRAELQFYRDFYKTLTKDLDIEQNPGKTVRGNYTFSMDFANIKLEIRHD